MLVRKKRGCFEATPLIFMAPAVGIEPTTN